MNEDQIITSKVKEEQELSQLIGCKGKISNIGYGNNDNSRFVKTPLDWNGGSKPPQPGLASKAVKQSDSSGDRFSDIMENPSGKIKNTRLIKPTYGMSKTPVPILNLTSMPRAKSPP